MKVSPRLVSVQKPKKEREKIVIEKEKPLVKQATATAKPEH